MRHVFGAPPLRFESRFESGNLQKVGLPYKYQLPPWLSETDFLFFSQQAFQTGDHSYELWMQPDINTRGNTQWFFFRCWGMQVALESNSASSPSLEMSQYCVSFIYPPPGCVLSSGGSELHLPPCQLRKELVALQRRYANPVATPF